MNGLFLRFIKQPYLCGVFLLIAALCLSHPQAAKADLYLISPKISKSAYAPSNAAQKRKAIEREMRDAQAKRAVQKTASRTEQCERTAPN